MKNIEVNPKPSRQLKNIVKSLATFQSAGNVFPYSFFSSLPVILLSIIILDKVLWLGLISKDIFRLSWHITVIAEIYVVNILFEKIIRLFTILHARNVIALTKSNETHFIVFLERFARWLNSRFSHLVGIIFLAVVSIASYPVFVSILSGNLFFTQSGEWLYYYVEELVVVDIVLGYLFGLAFWRLTIITFSIVQFSKNYKIKVRFTHPDKSGGLKPIGEVCFLSALGLLVPATFLSLWLLIAQTPNYQGYGMWSSYFSNLLLILIFLALFLFFRPLYYIHKQMQDQHEEVCRNLDFYIQKFELTNKEVTNSSFLITDKDDKELIYIENITRTYEKILQAPTWPFDLEIIIKLVSSITIPVLTLTGVANPIVKILEVTISSMVK